MLNQHGVAKYCYRCNIWLKSPDEIMVHFKEHQRQPARFCGIIRRQRLLISDGECLFCNLMGFSKPCRLREHLKDELKKYYQRVLSRPCPSKGCSQDVVYNKDDLILHLYDMHGLEDLGRNNSQRKSSKSSPQSSIINQGLSEASTVVESELESPISSTTSEALNDMQYKHEHPYNFNPNTINSMFQFEPFSFEDITGEISESNGWEYSCEKIPMAEEYHGNEMKFIVVDPDLDTPHMTSRGFTDVHDELLNGNQFSMDGMPMVPWI
jgi:hypothetical protein